MSQQGAYADGMRNVGQNFDTYWALTSLKSDVALSALFDNISPLTITKSGLIARINDSADTLAALTDAQYAAREAALFDLLLGFITLPVFNPSPDIPGILDSAVQQLDAIDLILTA